ncbi:tapasin-related protein-like [Pholidichthys leucotaenia]
MGFILKLLIYLSVCACARCSPEIPWLRCQFTDEEVSLNAEGHTETRLIPREAMLQFGQKGDAAVNPQAVTFLITGSKLDLRRYVEGVEADKLKCELRRYSTEGTGVRWPAQRGKEYNRWFLCTLKHSMGFFTVNSFLRHPSDEHPPGQADYRQWPVIPDREILTTTVAMVLKTQYPNVKAGLMSQQKLHCQFAVDHKAADITVEWHRQQRGERIGLFSHSSRSGRTKGTGVELKALATGDASYILSMTKVNDVGTYICSVSVNPLYTSVDVNLHIEEPPRVSLNVDSKFVMQKDRKHKVVCEAENYYPLDVEITWYEQDLSLSGLKVGASLPKVLQNVLMSSHKHSKDSTYTVSAYFYLKASLADSGRQFTCSVSHQSLRVPIRKSFILIVEEQSNLMFNPAVLVIVFTLVGGLYMLAVWRSGRRRSFQVRPR